MTAFLYPSGLSARPIFSAQGLGLMAFARYVKVLELAAQRSTASGVLALPWADWLELLECNDSTLADFFKAMQRAGLLVRGDDESVTVTQFAGLIPEPPPYFLFTAAEQVANWCALELSMPGWMLEKPETVALFRRWVATNVTREELEAAAAEAATTQHSLSPDVLHVQLQAIRKHRIEQARTL